RVTRISLHILRCSLSSCLSFFFQSYATHPDLHSFPTRRSSDLCAATPPEHGLARCGRQGLGQPPPGPCPSSRATICVSCSSMARSEEHTSELQSLAYLVCRLLLEKKKKKKKLDQKYSTTIVTIH